ncbi:protein of unknown function DUF427 [Stanieria cyanosphaera PCC 7437]|uniref:DUF427 domain-containing protein n=1 Tax=Stanieria cyanosphaera (strain ATCC 29371 / PCC 7437) TaxID=111780 RepID=K9XVD1_STAC7|nr:DUF427 domain-containing protein [Stanieria cyanosphaera]AFZ36024.1 protein of unknown function DUF427 [Stanieria cyanosphaera PCC 7437]
MFIPKPIPPQPGQESVWDYPRPPRLESSTQHIQVIFNQITLADSHRTYRVLETSHPPVYYIPPEDIQMQYLEKTTRQSFCEWKGAANYYTITAGDRKEINAAWFYPDPTDEFAAIKNYVAFYPSRMDACYVDGEQVQPQSGDFYGGWITKNVVGPFKGSAGSWGW